ncbi:hypothetical protein HBI38_145740 [Parastagonospora nodorum]|nr:hypothetical protein HBI41_180760 [Parastagonospora nodorum]KAH6284262.1 hypothetical protein HBI40_136840 [Parastagonospora nodorum]KAH6315745.1 hypothetical protein HBI38_145740 [Parastagonospora nodorum]
MLQSSTVSSRCAALNTSIAQVIPDISQFARKVRDARHDLNVINNDLLIIRTGLGIAQDDFSSSRSAYPEALLDAFTQILDSCDNTSERLHKTFLRLNCSLLPQDDWQTSKNGVLASMRQDLEGSRMVLDLSLDYLALYVQIPGQETTIDSFLGGYVSSITTATDELLKKTDIEEIQVNHIARERLPSLLQAIRLLRSCITAMSRKKKAVVPRTTTPRPDSLEPSLGDSRRSLRHAPLHENTMSSSSSGKKGIGSWLAGIPVSDDAQPLRHSRIVEMSIPKTSRRSRSRASLRETLTLSRGTFYTDDGLTSPTLTTAPESRLKKTRSWSSGITAQYATHDSSTTKVPSKYSPSKYSQSITSSNVSVIHKKITCDKVAVAKENRKNLDVSSRVGVDRILANVPAEATASDVERILWEGANPMVAHAEFGYFFIRAAYEMSPDILRVLLDFGADITKTMPLPNIYHSVMHAATLGAQLPTLEYLLSLGHSIDMLNAVGETPLVLATKTPGCFEVAKYLLDQGADVNHETEDGETPLYLALTGKAVEGRERSRMIEMLQQYGAEGNVHMGDGGRGERDKKGRMVLGIT